MLAYPVYDKIQLGAALKRVALLEGDFILRSGRRSSYYLDKYLFEAVPEILKNIAVHLVPLVSAETQRLAGVELGGIPLVTALSLETGLSAIFVRKGAKEYGTSKQVEGQFTKGEKITLVEDVVTTGGASIEGVTVLRSLGLEVLRVIAVLDRQEGAEEAFAKVEVPFKVLFTKSELGIT